jgi:alkaline phosphatase
MDRTASEMSLTEITDKAITLLDNPNGFFLMVESGKIDWACHANDAAAAIRDTLEFDNAIAEALAFYEQHPTETLIVVTGDHECGGMTIGFAGTPGSGSGVGTGYATYMELLPKQTISYDAFTNTVLKAYKENDAALDAMNGYPKAIALLETYFGLKTTGDAETDRSVLTAMDLEDIVAGFVQTLNAPEDRSTERLYTKYGKSYYDPFTITLTHVLNRKSGISWTSYSHTGVPLMTNAQGAGQELFQGYYDNTDIAKKIMAAMGLSQ